MRDAYYFTQPQTDFQPTTLLTLRISLWLQLMKTAHIKTGQTLFTGLQQSYAYFHVTRGVNFLVLTCGMLDLPTTGFLVP